MNWCRFAFLFWNKSCFSENLLTWCRLHESSAWSRKSPQRQCWLDCEWQPRPPIPAHHTGAERHHHSDVYTCFWKKKSCAHLPTLCSPLLSQKPLPVLVYSYNHIPEWTKRGKYLSVRRHFSVAFKWGKMFFLYHYMGFVWVVRLGHQAFVVLNVFKCLTR